jgi:predicted small metal-binding protein
VQCYCNVSARTAGHNDRDDIQSRRTEKKGADEMTKIVRCTCGLDLRGNDEADLIARVQRHAGEAHDFKLNDEQVRAMMEVDQQKGERQ